jgi:hypothetical protein
MNHRVPLSRSLRVCAALAGVLAIPMAQARNVQHMVPVAEALAAARADDGIAGVEFAFGSASAQGAEIVGGAASAQGVASPYAAPHDFKPSDDEVCRNAFRDALKRLAQQARAAGGHAVVGLVSTYNGTTIDDAGQVECRLGQSKALVTLTGVIARTVPAAAPAAH